MRKISHQEFLSRVNDINPNIEIMGTYFGMDNYIKCKCLIHNEIWEGKANNIIRNKSKCPKCSKAKHKLSHEEFISKMEKINPNINFLEKYISSHSKITCECKIDGNVWKAMPIKLLLGQGCPICGNVKRAKSKTKSHSEFIKEIQIINPDIEIESQYEGIEKPIIAKCKIDGYVWNTTPIRLLHGSKCKKCVNKTMSLSNEEFISRLYKISPNILPMEKYVNTITRIKYKCLDCGSITEALPSNLLKGYNCPICRKSKGEKSVQIYLINIILNIFHSILLMICVVIKIIY